MFPLNIVEIGYLLLSSKFDFWKQLQSATVSYITKMPQMSNWASAEWQMSTFYFPATVLSNEWSYFLQSILSTISTTWSLSRYDIEGSDLGDCAASFCFPACVNCQTASEVRARMNDEEWPQHRELDCREDYMCHVNIVCCSNKIKILNKYIWKY